MSFLHYFVLTLQVVSAVLTIGLVLLQHSKGDSNVAAGDVASGATVLTRLTGGLVAVFFVCTLLLPYTSGATVQPPSAAPGQPASKVTPRLTTAGADAPLTGGVRNGQ